MGIRKYPLPGGDGDESKVVYPLGLGMGMNFYYGNGDGIMIPVPAPPRCHPYTHGKPCKQYIFHVLTYQFLSKTTQMAQIKENISDEPLQFDYEDL